jgi:transposase
MVLFLAEEWGVKTSQPAVARLLKRVRIRNKKGQRVGHTQSQPLRVAWQAQMQDITAEQLVFIDESLFKQQTGWRLMAYGPIGSPARYADDTARGNTWSILLAYTVDGYLPCTGIRLGFFDGDAFVAWVLNELLPHLRPFPEPRSVVCLDNLNVHLDPQVLAALEEKGCLIRFLPPYSPDYNPIELTFGILKVSIFPFLLIFLFIYSIANYFVYTGLDATTLSKLSTLVSRRF